MLDIINGISLNLLACFGNQLIELFIVKQSFLIITKESRKMKSHAWQSLVERLSVV